MNMFDLKDSLSIQADDLQDGYYVTRPNRRLVETLGIEAAEIVLEALKDAFDAGCEHSKDANDDKLGERIDELETDVSALEDERDKLEDTVEALQEEVSELRTELSTTA